MPNHYIGSEGFEFWHGDPPALEQQAVESFSRPGVDGVGLQLAGKRGRQFEATLTAHLPTYYDAIAKANVYRQLVGTGLLVVTYNGVNFFQSFQHKYSIDDFQLIEIQTAILIGPLGNGLSYFYPNGGRIVGRFVMTPHKV